MKSLDPSTGLLCAVLMAAHCVNLPAQEAAVGKPEAGIAPNTLTPEAESSYRTFTNTEGKQIRAKLVDKRGNIAHLRMTDGAIYRVSIAKLSQSDQEYVDGWDPVGVREAELRRVDLDELFTARGFEGVPLVLKNNQALLEITVAGETLTFLLDTGAQMSVLDQARAKSLKLPVRENAGVAGGIGGNAGAVGLVRIENVQVGDVRKSGVLLAVMDLAGVQHGGSKFDGIIGFDLLKSLEAVIDYKSATLYLRED